MQAFGHRITALCRALMAGPVEAGTLS
jgi:hypothetical protein